MLKKVYNIHNTYVTDLTGASIGLEHIHRYLLVKRAVTDKIVLDIACGEGYGCAILAQVAQYVYGVDIAPDTVKHCQSKYHFNNLEFRIGSCTTIPLENASVDVVVSFETIEHHAEHELFMLEIKRILRPGGVLIISSPDKRECTEKTGILNPHHAKELYCDEFQNLLNNFFISHRLYGQRVLYGSAIFCKNEKTQITSYHITNNINLGEKGLTLPFFWIAVASDGVLPIVDSSFLEQSLDDIEEFKIQKMIIEDREKQIANHLCSEKNLFTTFYKVKNLLRHVYWRFPCLHNLRHGFKNWEKSVKHNIFSTENILALCDLSQRRFNEQAIRTAIPVSTTNEWPVIDISVVTWNSDKWIKMFCNALLVQRYPLSKLHLRFVDHGSTDGTLNKIQNFLKEKETLFASATLLQQKNLGFGSGHDYAIRSGNSDYCLVANVDMECMPDALCNVVQTALADTEATVASWELRQIPYEHPKHYDPVTLETNWSSHACILLRRTAYEKVGGYEPALFMYAEDVELSYRFRSFGYVLKYVPSATIRHYTYESTDTVKPLQFTGSRLGNLFVRFRYGHLRDIVFGILLYLFLFIKRAPFKGAKRILLFNALTMLPSLLNIRSQKGTVKAHYPFYGWDYEMVREGGHLPIQPLLFESQKIPKVSVLIRTYKGRGFLLRQAIQSVFNQTYPIIELIVSEDGGNTQQEIVNDMARRAPKEYSVRYLANSKQGRSATGNAALRLASGQYFIFFDDDDLLYADHIEMLVYALQEHPDCPVAYALGTKVSTNIDILSATYDEESYNSMECLKQEWDYNTLLHHNYILIHALVRRTLYEERGGFDTEIELLEDWNLWLRYGYGNNFIYIPKTTSLFRTPAAHHAATARSLEFHKANDEAKKRAMLSLQQLELI